jgi:hypothetical protein
MGHRPIIRELQPLVKSKGRDLEAAKRLWPRFVAAITTPDLLGVVAFCVIGLLLALNFALRFPDFGAVFEQYNQF